MAAKTLDLTFDIISKRNDPPFAIIGSFGGVSAQGSVVAHLYIEYPAMPNSASIKIDEESGQVLEHLMEVRRNHHVREVVSSIVMTPEIARALGDWLRQQADKAENLALGKKSE